MVKGIWIILFLSLFSLGLVSAELSVGIYRIVGEPKIISCTPNFIETFEEGIVTIKVKNIADESGQFNFIVMCDGKNYNYQQFQEHFEAGEEMEKTLKVGGYNPDADTPKNVKCEILVRDVGSYYENQDSCEVDVKVKPCNYCYDGGIKCNQEKGYLEKCADNNCEMEIVEHCSEGCGWNKYDSKYSCKEDIPKPNYWPYFIIPLIIILIVGWFVINKKGKKK